MRMLFLLCALLLFLYQSAAVPGDLYDSLQCHYNHGHCRRLCFHNERPIGTCTNGRQRCCK